MIAEVVYWYAIRAPRGRQRSSACGASRAAVDRLSFVPVDPELLAILVCPKTRGALEKVALPDDVRRALIEKYREKFRDEEPVVEEGLYSPEAGLVYPIVSDIPVMLIDEALPASSVGR
jgi:uncharacterized protein YbaR (Trm112 family)